MASSDEDTRRSSSPIARIRCTRWFDQQDMHFPVRHGPVLAPLGHNKNLTRVEGDSAIP